MIDQFRRNLLTTGAAAAAMAAAPEASAQQGGSYVKKGPVQIHFEEFGSGFPLLLISGGGLNSSFRSPDMPELEYQFRNWYYFSWLSGDFIVDNLVHGIDISNWIHGSYPVRAHGMGALSERSPDYGNLFDHFAIEWEYASGARLFGECDRRPGCWASVTNHAFGSEGKADFLDGREMYSITGKHPWQMRSERTENPYQQEHDDFFKAIREDLPYNEVEYGAKSTMTAIMGRMAAYSGKIVEWDAALNSNLSLAPDIHTLGDTPPVLPDKDGLYPIPIAGKTVAL